MNSKRFFLFAASFIFTCIFTCSLQAQTATACLAHHPQYISGVLETNYTQNCTGHDEPELFRFPALQVPRVISHGPSCFPPTAAPAFQMSVLILVWRHGYRSQEPLQQAFVELQFYPDSLVSKCFNDGSFSVNFAPNTFTACSPVIQAGAE